MISVQQMTAAELAAHAEPEDEAGFGALHTERGNLPLESIDVAASITGLAVRTELTQGFHNPYDEPLEATYIFPLPDRAAVTALSMRADGRVVDGILRERGAARAEYQQAVDAGQRAAIVEEERPGVFTMRVGNIAPGERVVIRLVLAGVLPFDDGAATFRFPLVVAPRFIPGQPLSGAPVGSGTYPDTDAVPDASRISPPVLLPGFPNPIRLSARIDIDATGLPLAGTSTSIPVRADADNPLRLHLQPGERANRDFVLRLRLGAPDAVGASFVIRSDEERQDEETGGTFALTLLPPNDSGTTRPRDVVLLLDRSASMGGWKMVAARRAAARIVDTLTEADTFAVLTFNHEVTRPPQLPTGLVQANDRNRFRAVEHLAGVTAQGGTVLLEPLRAGVDLLRSHDLLTNTPLPTGRERAVVLVTDGQVGNEDQILRTLAPTLAGIRVHTVGVDTAVNEAFLRRLSALAGGRCELVESEDRLDEAMRAIHRRIATPLVTDLKISAAGLTLTPESVAPQPIPDLFAGAPILLTGRVGADLPEPLGDGSVTVTGKTLDGARWSQTLTAVPSDNAALGAVWARARVRDLEDRYTTTGFGDGPRLAELERDIVRTSLRFGVLCRFTAFVAVDSRVVNVGGKPKQVTQPVDLPAGWEMGQPRSPAMPVARPAAMLLSYSAGGLGLPGPGFAGPAAESAPAAGSAVPASGSAVGPDAVAPSGLPGLPGRGRAKARRTRVERALRYSPAHNPSPKIMAGQVEIPPMPDSVRQFALRALRHLAELARAPLAERVAALVELAGATGTALDGFLADGLPDLEALLLRTFAAELALPIAGEAELQRRWLYVLDVLQPLAGEDETDPADETEAPEVRPFWKR
ncbi:MAG TPA: VIT domain-containing protein [Pseudonocardiaceae bacterium]|jgi:Ca-activated chloride channel family protein|nr:VIT domain-containing protein [Pseudonocardiaceae bacterium]